MPILRAGPFANGSNSFLNEPENPFDAQPVNCNRNASDTWPFRFRLIKQSDFDTVTDKFEDGFPISEEVLVTSVETDDLLFVFPSALLGSMEIWFYYQASEDWEMDYNISLTISNQSGLAGHFIFNDGPENPLNITSGGDTGEYSGTFLMPKAVKPREFSLRVSIDSAFEPEGNEGTISIALS